MDAEQLMHNLAESERQFPASREQSANARRELAKLGISDETSQHPSGGNCLEFFKGGKRIKVIRL